MKKSDILNKLTKLNIPSLTSGEVQIIIKLVTILAATHLANKVYKIIKELDKLEHPNDIISILK